MTQNEEYKEFEEKKKNSDVSYLKDVVFDGQNLWEEVKFEISQDVRSIVWKAWIEPLKFIKYERSILYISAESYLMSSRIETHYYEKIFLKAKNKYLDITRIEIVNIKNSQLIDKKINKEKNTFTSSNIDFEIDEKKSFLTSASMQLNSKLTFDSFVVGNSNQMPYAASKRVCEAPSEYYNPLYLYGQVGIGKTHLLNAIALEIKQKFPKRKVVYMSAERFMYQFIKSIRSKNTIQFKDEFRSVDVLMIDDIQFISGKGSTQEEFFYTFNDLIDQKKQIIITSNKAPVELTDLDEKLRSRLGGGLVIDFRPTNFDLRLKILNKKSHALSLLLPQEVLEFLANKIVSNIRELEGALNRICSHHELTGKAISIENTEELLSDLLAVNEKQISIEFIQQKVSSYFNINVSEMGSPRRSISIARPRQIAMYLCKKNTSFSYPEIGRSFGGKDHTTVIHAVKKIETLSKKDNKLQNALVDLTKLMRT